MNNSIKRLWVIVLVICLCIAQGMTSRVEASKKESYESQCESFSQKEQSPASQLPVVIQSEPATLAPLSNYPVNSFFSRTGVACTCHHGNDCDYFGNCDCLSYDNSIQCMGFAEFAYDQFSHRSSWVNISGDRDNTIRDISTAAKAQQHMGILPVGSYIRVARPDGNQTTGNHSFVIIGKSTSGITVYEANYTGKCKVGIRTLTFADIASEYSKITTSISHNYTGTVFKYNSTYHKVYCASTGCTGYMMEKHYALYPGANATCLGCGYKGWISQGVQNINNPDFQE